MVLSDAGNDVLLWGKDAEVAEAINRRHENPQYHPGVPLPEAIRATLDVEEALDGADQVVLALPSHVFRDNLTAWRDLLSAGLPDRQPVPRASSSAPACG